MALNRNGMRTGFSYQRAKGFERPTSIRREIGLVEFEQCIGADDEAAFAGAILLVDRLNTFRNLDGAGLLPGPLGRWISPGFCHVLCATTETALKKKGNIRMGAIVGGRQTRG